MKISKILIATVFAAGFVTTSGYAALAADTPVDGEMCIEGTIEVDGVIQCQDGLQAPEEGVMTTEDCWEGPEGTVACARGGVAPEPTDLMNDESCTTSVDADDNEITACADAVSGEVSDNGPILEKGELEDRQLMYSSGVGAEATSNNIASNTLAAFGVLVAALGAFGIGISKEREAKK